MSVQLCVRACLSPGGSMLRPASRRFLVSTLSIVHSSNSRVHAVMLHSSLVEYFASVSYRRCQLTEFPRTRKMIKKQIFQLQITSHNSASVDHRVRSYYICSLTCIRNCLQSVPILSVFPALIVHSELKSVHPGFPVAFIFKHKLINK